MAYRLLRLTRRKALLPTEARVTLPVPVFKSVSILSTRRIHEGRFHLRPDPVVTQCIEYALAYSANKYNIELYAAFCASNHLHDSFFDPEGRHPEFRRDFHSLVTRWVNRLRGMSEAKWSPDHKSPVLLHDTEALLDKIAYVIANPCMHDLVDEPEDYPGLLSRIAELAGPPRTIRIPVQCYDPEGDLPETVELRFTKPPELAHLTDDEYREEIRRRVVEKCREARAKRKREGRRPLGRVAILSQSPTDQPKSQPRIRSRNPRVACRNVKLRIAFLLWLDWFRKEHRSARIAFEMGDVDVEFPYGTYLHVLRYGVNCSTIGPPSG